MAERQFSFLYKEIVEDENDMIGHIAYSLYKSNKIRYIEDFKKDNAGKTPDENDIAAFHRSVKTTIPALKIQAEQILSNFTELTLDEQVYEIEEKLKNNQDVRLKEMITPLIPPKPKGPWDGFWMAVIVKLTQAVIVAIVIFFIIFAASAKDDFWGTFKRILPESHRTPDSLQVHH